MQYILAVGLMFILSIPIMLICGAFTNYLLSTIISAWSIEGGNLQILGFLFDLFGVPQNITAMIGKVLIAEIVLIGSIFGLVVATDTIATKYLPKINLITVSMIFAAVLGVGLLFLDSSVDGIYKVFAILNIVVVLYISSRMCIKDQTHLVEEEL